MQMKVDLMKKKYFQESLSGPFTNAKTQELPGALDPRRGSAPGPYQGPLSGSLDPTPLDALLAPLSW